MPVLRQCSNNLLDFLRVLLGDRRKLAICPAVFDKNVQEGPYLVSIFLVPAVGVLVHVIRDSFFERDAGRGGKRLKRGGSDVRGILIRIVLKALSGFQNAPEHVPAALA